MFLEGSFVFSVMCKEEGGMELRTQSLSLPTHLC